MLKAREVLTQITNDEDIPFLRNTLFDVNMRLFNNVEYYRNIILRICKDMKWLALNKYEDYSEPFGMSGANMGIPFNIIAIVEGRKTSIPTAKILINPHILRYSNEIRISESNCGSLRLPSAIKVRRPKWAEVSYFDENGNSHKDYFWQTTIQHEIDHNNGILITDSERKVN